jgi:hypothetical protein
MGMIFREPLFNAAHQDRVPCHERLGREHTVALHIRRPEFNTRGHPSLLQIGFWLNLDF